MTVTTYIGIVHEGQIHLTEPVMLPEGSHVQIVVSVVVDERTARRKANRWLIENVGNMVMADQPVLVQSEGRSIWRFGAFVTAMSHDPFGPIGQVEVDAINGEVLTNTYLAEEMIQRGEHFEHSPPSTES